MDDVSTWVACLEALLLELGEPNLVAFPIPVGYL